MVAAGAVAGPGSAIARPSALEVLEGLGAPGAAPRPGARAAALAPDRLAPSEAVARPAAAAAPAAARIAAERPAPILLVPEALSTVPTAPTAQTVQPAQPAAPAGSLTALLARALAEDPQVRVAAQALAIAESRWRQARSRLGPALTLSSVAGQSLDEEAGQRALTRETRRTEAGLRWNLYNQGQDLAELRGSARERDAAAEEWRRAREEAAERLLLAWLDRQRLEAVLPRAEARLAALERLAGQLRRQAELGKAADADGLQAEAALADAVLVAEQLRAEARAARTRLDRLAGQPVGPAEGFDAAALLGAAPAGAVAAATEPPGPDQPAPGQQRAAEARADAARDRLRPAASWLAPRIDLELRRQLADTTRPALSTAQQQGWLLSARWELPVAGELPARQAEQRHRALAAAAEADRVVRDIQGELEQLGPRIDQAREAVAQLARQLERHQALVRAGELQQAAGRRSLAQLMQLHDSRFAVEQRLADARQRLHAALLRQRLLQGQLLPALGLTE